MTGNDELFQLLQQGIRPAFRTGFADRVMARIDALPALQRPVFLLSVNLQRYFVRLVPVAAALAIALGAYNLAGRKRLNQSALDAIIGLPAVTLAAAYSLDVAP
jgi:hypothetical protein